jgi:hypothetical protein
MDEFYVQMKVSLRPLVPVIILALLSPSGSALAATASRSEPDPALPDPVASPAAMDQELQELVDSNRDAAPARETTWRVSAGRPLKLSASYGWLTLVPTDGGEDGGIEDDLDVTPATLAQLEVGLAGAKLSFGLAAARGEYGSAMRDARSAGDVKLSVLRTYGHPVGVAPGQFFVGGEIDAHWFLTLGVGIFRRVGGGTAGGESWLMAADVGVGFL